MNFHSLLEGGRRRKPPDISAGHDSGFGERYLQSLRTLDSQIGHLLDKVDERQRLNPQEDWLVIVSTDHGRDYWGKAHGGISEQEKTIFIASNKPLNQELSQPSIPAENPGPNHLYSLPAQTSVAPTVLRHMGSHGPETAAGMATGWHIPCWVIPPYVLVLDGTPAAVRNRPAGKAFAIEGSIY